MFQLGPKQNAAKSFQDVPLLKLIFPISVASVVSYCDTPFITSLDVVVAAAAQVHNSIACMAS